MSLSPESLYLDAARRSISSNSSSTAPPNSFFSVEEDYDYKKYEVSIIESKPLPLLPSSISDESNPYSIEYPASHPSESPIPSLTTISQLAYALGPDSIPHTTEIDTVPCAGIRIPHGALTGLLAWRLVVRLAPPSKEKRGWWDNYTDRRNNYSEPTVHTPQYTGAPLTIPFTSVSAISLPLFTQVLSPTGAGNLHDLARKVRPSSFVLTRQPHSSKTHPRRSRLQPQSQMHETSSPISNALVVNFILDTSLPYSIISRDTLIALGYPILHLLSSMPLATVTLSIQNIPTRFHIARPNEASRLGVQFLHDAGVSVLFPKDGLGVGPVLYVESVNLLKDVPRTISPQQKLGIKLTLPQRVRALFGYSQRDR